MTKDDKEFFDKAMIAAITGLSSFDSIHCTNTQIASVGEAAKLIAESSLKVRNEYLSAAGYQEPTKAVNRYPDILGAEVQDHVHGTVTHFKNTMSIESAGRDMEQLLTQATEGITSCGIHIRFILDVAESNKGKKLTATEIYWLIYTAGPSFVSQPTINHLRDIGKVLRQNGYRTVRSGGRDLYLL